MDGEGAETSALGLFLTDKMQHVDNYTVIEHSKAHCTSNQYYKGVLDDISTGAFNGKIHVHPNAQKTEAFQTNNNILLSNTAKMHSKPRLEDESRLMLMDAFTWDVISKIKQPSLQDRITELVGKRLRGELSRCNNCAMHCQE